MTAPAVSQVATDLYDELGVTQPVDELLDWPFLIFLDGLATALGRVPTIVRDTDDGPGWSAVLDVARSPAWALPWLAQFVGVTLVTGDDDTADRARISAHAKFQRGTPAAMRAAAQQHLTGTQHVAILEADTSPYHLTVFTLTDETADPDLVEAVVRAQKPAGLILAYEVVDGLSWDEATSTWDTAPDVAWDDANISNPV